MKLTFAGLLLQITITLAQPENTLFNRQTSIASNTTECSNPQPNECSFYAQCLQTRYNCSPSDYPLADGQKYCEKFQADASDLSSAGQKWMETVMLCLQRALVPYALGGNQSFASCSALNDYAFGTHPKCYVQSGLCTLPPSDWEAIVFKIVGLNTLFGSWDALKATVETAVGCEEFYLWAIEQKVF
ncbi:hypothetical protein BGW36DRAFT_382419 [Talaromyces proteolyticus]|uniref:Extracellular membrane protein CFEM domain-containing protein n=1 Tax=Talaromyces proteolyticus TaxID=1131652 RepID=A0AAD4KRA5_9EURO|nr:uncharacterized protein BGW36DRAFT_382419 [Talaromyces proteolyticus]KAH8695271.1 hypothetical protein BGW36DRAFT_382419 [Talaromyces proteolyticus]